MTITKRWLPDVVALLFLISLTLVVFGYRSGHLGFYGDDATFMGTISPYMSWSKLITGVRSYVTGRNLHILWQYLIFVVAGGNSIDHLPQLHAIQTIFDAANVALLYTIIRLWFIPIAPSFLASTMFIIFPNHSETHFWLSALPMNILSTFFVLLLLCLSILLIRIANLQNSTRWPTIGLVACSMVFIFGMFTYDQVVPIIMVIVTILTILLFIRDRRLRLPGIVFAIFCWAIFFSLIFWKINEPRWGPTFTYVSFRHVFFTFLESIQIWKTTILLPLSMPALWGLSDPINKIVCLILTGIIVTVFGVFMGYHDDVKVPLNYSFAGMKLSHLFPTVSLLCAGLSFTLLSYLPAYLWFLAPRHSYLPSVGIAMMIASLSTAIIRYLQRISWMKILGIFAIGYFLLSSILAIFVEKEFWISSYKLRKNMYDSIAGNASLNGRSNLILVNFPSSPFPGSPSGPFLIHEYYLAPYLATKGRLAVKRIVLHAVPSKTGFYVETEYDCSRAGGELFKHISSHDSAVVWFQGIDANNLRIIYDDDQNKFKPNTFYQLNHNNFDLSGDTVNFTSRLVDESYVISVPAIPINREEVLTLVGYIKQNTISSPALYNYSWDYDKFVIPIDVSGDRNGKAGFFCLRFQIPIPKLDSFRLYIVDEKQARFVGEATISR